MEILMYFIAITAGEAAFWAASIAFGLMTVLFFGAAFSRFMLDVFS